MQIDFLANATMAALRLILAIMRLKTLVSLLFFILDTTCATSTSIVLRCLDPCSVMLHDFFFPADSFKSYSEQEHRRLSRTDYSRRCAEASAVQAYQERGLSLVPDMEIGYVVEDLISRSSTLIFRLL